MNTEKEKRSTSSFNPSWREICIMKLTPLLNIVNMVYSFPWYIPTAGYFLLFILAILYPRMIFGGLHFGVVVYCVTELFVFKQTDIHQPTNFLARLKVCSS